MTVSLQNNLSELDTLLADLNSARYAAEQNDHDRQEEPGEGATVSAKTSAANYAAVSSAKTSFSTSNYGEVSAKTSFSNSNYAYGDYYSDLDSSLDEKAPSRPPPPASYGALPSIITTSPIPPIAQRKSRKPPKLMHVLVPGERRQVHDLAREARDPDDKMDIDVQDTDGTDYGDYTSKWEYLGKGIWENQDYGSVSNYSTLKTSRDENYDYATLPKSQTTPVISEDELEKETGAGPRGERSKFIETDHGEVKSKYHYLGFGLWENTDPSPPKPKPKKPSPPPPPPKAEPIWYNCSATVVVHYSSKELDDLHKHDAFNNMPSRDVEVAEGIGDLGAGIGEPYEPFDKEDMSDMFRRAMLEKMGLRDNDNRPRYNCYVCKHLIGGAIITAQCNKFHPECFVCTYCREEFKDRKFKSDPRDYKPYCYLCFEKLLGHFGNAHHATPHGSN